jgi:hypothetical protein
MTLQEILSRLALLRTPEIIIVLFFGTRILESLLRYRKQLEIARLHHAQCMAAIALGLPVLPLPPEALLDCRCHHRAFTRGAGQGSGIRSTPT